MTQEVTKESGSRTYALRGLSEKQAQVLADSLELLSRLSLGQLEYIADLARFGVITHSDGTIATPELVRYAEENLLSAKFLLTGFAPSASKSVGGETVQTGNIAWEMRKVIRHQLAWDRSPGGGHGVDFGDPHLLHYSAEPHVRLELEQPNATETGDSA